MLVFFANSFRQADPFAQDPFAHKAATGQQAETNRESTRYDIETETDCVVRFGDRTRGIIQELKAKGVDLGPGPDSGYFEAMIKQGRCLSEYQYGKFLDLAYRIDGQGKLVVF